jgi:phosphatidylglycerol:prolipoprotein diacylglycerol transferase
MSHIIIDNQSGGQIYALFYTLALLTGILAFIFSGVKNKYPLYKLLLITAGGTLFFILGTKLLVMSPQALGNFLDGSLPAGSGGKTILGGLMGLIAGGFLTARLLNTGYRVFDNLAIALPLGMAINRAGCLFAGCCHGTPSDLPWAVCYPMHSHAFQVQLSEGLVHPWDLVSLPVHPTQLYDIVCCLLISFAIWRTRHFWKAPGSRLLLAVLLYGIARIFIEFFREPATDPYTSGLWLGMKVVQWLVGAGVVILAGILVLHERSWQKRKVLPDDRPAGIGRQLALLSSLAFIYLIFHRIFDVLEQTLVLLALLPAMVTVGWKALGVLIDIGYRVKTAIMSVACLLLMSQTYIPDNDSTKVRYFEGGLAGIFGHYRDFTGTAYKGTDCDGDTYYAFENVQYIKYNYQLLGANFSYNERIGPYNRLSVSLSGYIGKEHSSVLDSNRYGSYSIYTINPNLRYSWRNAGIDVGFHAGSFTYAHFVGETDGLAKRTYNSEDQTPNHRFNFMPSAGLRLGPQNIVYAEATFGSSYPYTSPLMKFSVGIGSGLGRFDGRKLGLGFCPGGLYLGCAVPVKDRVVIQALFMENFTPDSRNRTHFSFSLNYRFGHKTINRPVASQ